MIKKSKNLSTNNLYDPKVEYESQTNVIFNNSILLRNNNVNYHNILNILYPPVYLWDNYFYEDSDVSTNKLNIEYIDNTLYVNINKVLKCKNKLLSSIVVENYDKKLFLLIDNNPSSHMFSVDGVLDSVKVFFIKHDEYVTYPYEIKF